jgi:hypothetical protein
MNLMLSLNIPLENLLDALQRRPEFEDSGFKFAVFLKRNFSM